MNHLHYTETREQPALFTDTREPPTCVWNGNQGTAYIIRKPGNNLHCTVNAKLHMDAFKCRSWIHVKAIMTAVTSWMYQRQRLEYCCLSYTNINYTYTEWAIWSLSIIHMCMNSAPGASKIQLMCIFLKKRKLHVDWTYCFDKLILQPTFTCTCTCTCMSSPVHIVQQIDLCSSSVLIFSPHHSFLTCTYHVQYKTCKVNWWSKNNHNIWLYCKTLII